MSTNASTAAAMPGAARVHGNGSGGGAFASRRTAAITAAANRGEARTREASFASARSISSGVIPCLLEPRVVLAERCDELPAQQIAAAR